MQPLFLAGHPAIDFLNTAFEPDGTAIETIGDGKAYLAWLVTAGLIEEREGAKLARRFGAKALDSAAAEAREAREWARGWLRRWRGTPRGDYAGEIAALNKLLARATLNRELAIGNEGLTMVETHAFDTATALIAPVAASIAALIVEEDPTLVRECAGTTCTLWFLDCTKSHRRLFCSASACGNRAKVAAFRERNRE